MRVHIGVCAGVLRVCKCAGRDTPKRVGREGYFATYWSGCYGCVYGVHQRDAEECRGMAAGR